MPALDTSCSWSSLGKFSPQLWSDPSSITLVMGGSDAVTPRLCWAVVLKMSRDKTVLTYIFSSLQVNLLIPLHLKDNKTQSPKWKINLKKSLSHTNQSQNGSVDSVLTQSKYLHVPP